MNQACVSSGKKKLLIVHFHHETNTFCPNLADIAAHKNLRFDIGEAALEKQRGLGTAASAFLKVFDPYEDVELIPTVAFVAEPSGPVTAEVYDIAVSEITKAVKLHAPIDGVLLNLHGAMVAEGHDDGEGDLLETVRSLVGWDIPVISTLDLHANVTEKMARCATAFVAYECYPHTDTYETGLLAATIMEETLDGKLSPQMAYRRVPFLLPLFPSDSPEMQPLYALAKEMEKRPGVRCVRFTHGFFPADIEEMGMSVMAITNGDKALADSLAEELADAIRKNIPNLKRVYPTLDEALDVALTPGDKPVVIADASDNPGAGSIGDTTHILRRILERGITGAAIATILDPESVNACEKAGVGSTVRLQLGGWSDPAFSGGPLEADAYVKMLTDGKYISKGKMDYGAEFNHGKTAVVEISGNTVFITSISKQPWDIEIFLRHGIDLEKQKLLVTKSAIHFRATYAPFVREMIAVELPGLASPVPQRLSYKKWKGTV